MSKNIDDYKKKKLLGKGMIGTTYLITIKNKNYALKIEHILKKDIKKSTASPLWREIEFATTMGNKYPEQFMKLYDHDIIDKCEHKQKYAYDLKVFGSKKQKEFEKLAKSPYCSRKIYSLVDYSLNDKLKKLNLQQKYSEIIQLIYIVYLMRKNGYIHGDFHFGNVGIKKTNKKYINIFSKKIPTYGYIYSAIDYGEVKHKKYKLNKKEKKILKDSIRDSWDIQIIIMLMYKSTFWDYIFKKKMFGQIVNFKKAIKDLKKHDVYPILKTYTDNIDQQMQFCDILYPEIHQKIRLGKKSPKKILKPKFSIPKEDVLYTLMNISDYENLINYFYLKF